MAELEADLTAWIAAWNDDPKPFVWTKTADEILDTLASYLHELTTQDTRMTIDPHKWLFLLVS